MDEYIFSLKTEFPALQLAHSALIWLRKLISMLQFSTRTRWDNSPPPPGGLGNARTKCFILFSLRTVSPIDRSVVFKDNMSVFTMGTIVQWDDSFQNPRCHFAISSSSSRAKACFLQQAEHLPLLPRWVQDLGLNLRLGPVAVVEQTSSACRGTDSEPLHACR